MPYIEFKVQWKGELVPLSAKWLYAEVQTMADAVVDAARQILKDQNKNATGTLFRDVVWELPLEGNTFTLVFPFRNSPYWKFVDQGVQGAISNAKAPNSPFKFGTGSGPPGGLVPAIDKWVIVKRLPDTRDARGKFIPRKRMVRAIARSVYLYGIKPTNFISDPLLMLFNQAKPKLEKGIRMDVEDFLGKNFPKEFQVTFKIEI